MEIDKRKIKILQVIINDYINTADPVGSRTIANRYNLGISSATIRNEMADLEDMGYLEQTHSSSGRKPSDKGYRLYVDKIMLPQSLSIEDEIKIKNELLNVALNEVEKMVKQATVLLSSLTKLTGIGKAPSISKSFIKSLQLIYVDSSNILAIVITDSGLIKNTMIRVKTPMNLDILAKLTNILNSRLRGLTIEEINLAVINNLRNDMIDHEYIFDAIIPTLYESLSHDNDLEVYVEGSANIFNYSEYNDIYKAKEFFLLLEDKEAIKSMMARAENINIVIGSENLPKEAKECSIITTQYCLGKIPLGVIGIIGPTRIPYSKVISVLTNITKELNEGISKLYFDDR
ncbi:MAG TPA: heat-inducible transcriptional repressor HrcA [Clostridiaceae bacterium]